MDELKLGGSPLHTAATSDKHTALSPARKRIGAVLLCLVLVFSLTGCRITIDEDGIMKTFQSVYEFFFGSGTKPTGDGTANVYPKGGKIKDLGDAGLRDTGSAMTLSGDVILIGVFVDNPDNPWTKEDLAQVKNNMDVATDWLEEQAAANDVDLAIHFGEPNTTFTIRDEVFSKDSTVDDTLTFNHQAARYLSNLDVSEITEKYDTDNVGYLVFLHEDYGAYTWPYVPSDFGADKYYYYEFCCLFLYDGTGMKSYENPATYAHEILHLFGASDLYEVNVAEGISKDLIRYVEETYPDELMYYTYEADNTSNYETITKKLSPFTLYFLGWKEDKDLLKEWPAIERDAAGVFPEGP